jgi:hypothetical protein
VSAGAEEHLGDAPTFRENLGGQPLEAILIELKG